MSRVPSGEKFTRNETNRGAGVECDVVALVSDLSGDLYQTDRIDLHLARFALESHRAGFADGEFAVGVIENNVMRRRTVEGRVISGLIPAIITSFGTSAGTCAVWISASESFRPPITISLFASAFPVPDCTILLAPITTSCGGVALQTWPSQFTGPNSAAIR